MKATKSIKPILDIGDILCKVEKPARYTGGEYGSIKKEYADLSVVIAFPDLYEIGMSNQAIKILYNGINRLEAVRCERVFTPAPDFEYQLFQNRIPLFSLESGFPIKDFDLLGISLGYELGITGALTILKAGFIPLKKTERKEDDPIIIFGGPAVSNPLPYYEFSDVFWIGEAENKFFDLVKELRLLKIGGATREELLERFYAEDSVWKPGKKAIRAVFSEFGQIKSEMSIFPIPSIKTVHDHAAIEIMRGCPNGCRFCHAGFWYRPMRQKSVTLIRDEVEIAIKKGGYKEITLTSLSSGDYNGIDLLIRELSEKYSSDNISFQLPSLKVSSFSLPILASLSRTRKAGLTFAIETPDENWQKIINKEVAFNDVVTILQSANKMGWRSAKFYFMIGLPINNDDNQFEEIKIVNFLNELVKNCGMYISINIGTFIPKPHTPFQWSTLLSEEQSYKKFKFIKDNIRHPRIKLSFHNPFVSVVEGMIARGGYEMSQIILEAFDQGCRLDAWDEYFNHSIWRGIIDKNIEKINEGKNNINRTILPWFEIDSRNRHDYLVNESLKSTTSKITSLCKNECTNYCGSCLKSSSISINNEASLINNLKNNEANLKLTKSDSRIFRLIFSFSKNKTAIFISHLSLIEVFNKSFIRASIPITYSNGFNPLPKVIFAASLALGIAADREICSIDINSYFDPQEFILLLNKCLPSGIRIHEAVLYEIPIGKKKISPPSILWGYLYKINNEYRIIRYGEEKLINIECIERYGSILKMRRINIFASTRDNIAIDYFTAYDTYFTRA